MYFLFITRTLLLRHCVKRPFLSISCFLYACLLVHCKEDDDMFTNVAATGSLLCSTERNGVMNCFLGNCFWKVKMKKHFLKLQKMLFLQGKNEKVLSVLCGMTRF